MSVHLHFLQAVSSVASFCINSLTQDSLKMKTVSLRITEVFLKVYTGDCSLT